MSEYFVNTLKWVVPGLLLFDGCRNRERYSWAVVCSLGVYVLLAIQVIKWMPIGYALLGDQLEARSGKILVKRGRLPPREPLDDAGAGRPGRLFSARTLLRGASRPALGVAALSAMALFAQSLTAGRTGYATWAIVGLVLCLLRWRGYLLLAPVAAFADRDRRARRVRPLHAGIRRGRCAPGRGGGRPYAVTSGRNLIWPYVIAKIEERPVVGYGRLAMKTTGLQAFLWDEMREAFPHPHNAYLELPARQRMARRPAGPALLPGDPEDGLLPVHGLAQPRVRRGRRQTPRRWCWRSRCGPGQPDLLPARGLRRDVVRDRPDAPRPVSATGRSPVPARAEYGPAQRPDAEAPDPRPVHRRRASGAPPEPPVRDASGRSGSGPPLVYLLAASHSGSTLLAFLLGGHPDVCTVGEIKVTSLGDPTRYRCSCGDHPACPFWTRVGTMAARGLPFDVTPPDRRPNGRDPYVRRLLRPLHRGRAGGGARSLPSCRRAGGRAASSRTNAALVHCLRDVTGRRWWSTPRRWRCGSSTC